MHAAPEAAVTPIAQVATASDLAEARLTPIYPDGKLRSLMNQGRRPAHARARASVPVVSLSAVALAGLGLACIPTAPRPDGGVVPAPSFEVRLGDCATAEQGLEFAPFKIGDFEAGTKNAAGQFVAQYLYTYTDNTATLTPNGYQAVLEPGKHCTDDPGNFVYHETGGPFLGWGGGLGVAMNHIVLATCMSSPAPDYCVPGGSQPEVAGLYLDASQWDGVAVWARRAAGGQPLLRVLVGNKYTDDDVNFMMSELYPNDVHYCERVRECACINNLPCTFSPDSDNGGPMGVVPGGGLYCGTPGLTNGQDISAVGDMQHATNTCGATRCNDPYPAFPQYGVDNFHLFGSDPQFANRDCRPFTYRSGITSSFCYNPDGTPPSAAVPQGLPPDPLPAETDQQCGDHWTYPLDLTTDWKLYLVPFSWMGQQGFAKRFTFFDLTSVSVARLTWDAGPLDFYIDDWRFYRVKRPTPDAATN